MPATFSCQLPRAVRTSTGAAMPASRQRRSSVRPSMRRQAEVEHHGVVLLGRAEELRARAVAGAVHGVTRPHRGRRQAACDSAISSSTTSTRTRRPVIAQMTLNGA